jgi:shikimate kinase
MVAILLTGMSGSGKSTALAELASRGFDTVDTDDGDWIEEVAGERLWRPDRVDDLLARPRARALFVQGTVANQGRWYPRFAAVVLLTAPAPVLLERLRTRTTNDFGKTAEERARVLGDIARVEPLLRASATHVVDTRAPSQRVADLLAGIAAEVGRG